MAEEEETGGASESSITEVDQSSEAGKTLATQASVEATIESCFQGGTESTCNNDDKTAVVSEISAATSDADGAKSLDLADEFMANGSKALKDSDYAEAVECFSRALEIRVSHYGELSLECVHAYYKYGCALLYKAQEEADPLGAAPKKEGESKRVPVKDESVDTAINGESYVASSSKKVDDVGADNSSGAANDVPNGSDQEGGEEDCDGDEVAEAEADEDETDLDLAWKMLDVARAITEKQSCDTMEKVDILSALAEVSMEREDFDTSLGDYKKSLSILERLVEPDSRHIAELNFRICLCLEIGPKPEDAIPYCQRAISVFQARKQRLLNESKNVSESTSASSASDTDIQTEIETLTGLANDMEKKLEDLQQLASSTQSVLSQILGIVASKSKDSEGSSSSMVPPLNASASSTTSRNGNFDAPSISTAQASGSTGVTHLGVVGRGVKRVVMNASTAEASPPKKPTLDSPEDNNK